MAAPTPQQTLQQIAMMARAGRLDEAAVLAATTFATHGDDPVLAALAGAVESHRRRFDRAITYLEVAHRLRPQDMTVRVNLAEALFHVGRAAAALALCDDASARAEPNLRLARLGGHLAQEAEEFERAVRLYRIVLARFPDDWALLNNLGNALSAINEHAEAARVLEKALKLAPDAAPIRVNLGNALLEAERFEEGEKVLQDAAREDPADVEPVLALATFYRRAGADDRSFEMLAEAARRAPGDAGVLSDYGQEASKRNDYATAEPAFEAALAIDPALWPSLVGLAALYERTNREAELEPLRERAEAAGGDAATLSFIDALRFKRADRVEEAFAALEAAGDVVVANRKHQLRGILLDRMGRYDEAFAEFTEMNRQHLAEPSDPAAKATMYRDMVEQGARTLTPDWVASWSPSPPEERPSPVILLGFPRSGTTLLDTMLMSAPGTLVMEEEHFILDIENELGGLDALAGLGAGDIAQARARYFEKVATLGDLGPDTMVIDKHPLHLNKVPVIRRLFPDAKFILALRHPCDVLLSCYITNFRTNHAMSNFLDLETAARLYDMTFSYWNKAREVFDLPVHTIVYERLVADQGRELGPLFEWLGLPWQGEAFDHREAARARGIVRTASYSQVTEPIYTRAAGRWHRYEKYLEPVFDRLRPWVEQFGYALGDDRVPQWGEPSGVPVEPA
ncbi:tetratricopeptide repeat-containing sulfotransferase family protein [Novosphingobium mangrovi (ex Huang et al. 2023)]|uniref:Sulfotransferase n=1 Tax=Novosphingobium mangrovi (ex Huang et al. 2023) TaxID=2976432 RepID=A0ABT2I4Y9_9SPHN|nr:tetratricopeptide repeat-containing sulfotransferase family protein [Novosphingobium mangrovi (ex Huang et al. 2023)]MCT2399673.1 sulfotransferase [Novosphingobium mangrovi (ex Huang et al. 2023)]